MAKMPVYDQNFTKVDEIEVNDAVFFGPVKDYLIHTVVKMQLANKRQGTASTKTRGEVSGGGKKPWKQKGTGRARVGSIRSPLWRKGGIIFGPKPRDYSYTVPKKVRRAAMRSALSQKTKDNKLFIIDDIKLPEVKTKHFISILKAFNINNTLVVMPSKNRDVELSARNIPNVKVLCIDSLNVYDVMKYENIMLHKQSLERIEGVYGL